MEFEAYLISKKIDPELFKNAEQGTWEKWSREFELLHPNSFTAQKLYLINPIRRKYPLKIIEGAVSPVAQAVTAKPKPVMRPKPKIN